MAKRHVGLTRTAKDIYKLAFMDSLPKGWRVEIVGFMRGAMGLCIYGERRILIGQGDHNRKSMIPTLVHELVHVRCPGLRHGKEFRRLERSALEKVWPDLVML